MSNKETLVTDALGTFIYNCLKKELLLKLLKIFSVNHLRNNTVTGMIYL